MDATGDGWFLVCQRCGSPLLGDPDDRTSDLDGRPLCGTCARNRDEEADLAMLDAGDGDLDGLIEW